MDEVASYTEELKANCWHYVISLPSGKTFEFTRHNRVERRNLEWAAYCAHHMEKHGITVLLDEELTETDIENSFVLTI